MEVRDTRSLSGYANLENALTQTSLVINMRKDDVLKRVGYEEVKECLDSLSDNAAPYRDFNAGTHTKHARLTDTLSQIENVCQHLREIVNEKLDCLMLPNSRSSHMLETKNIS